jgi:hypothetical protein
MLSRFTLHFGAATFAIDCAASEGWCAVQISNLQQHPSRSFQQEMLVPLITSYFW